MYLLREFNESNHVEMVTESVNAKHLKIRGVFAEGELKNRNGRIYEGKVLKPAIQKYISEMVDKNRAMGELNHPQGRPNVDPAMAAIRISKLEYNDNSHQVMGEAIVLNTPQGQILRGLLEGGVQMGVSTRALGSIRESAGVKYVQPDLQIFAIDAVSDPSAINAFVTAVNESQEWVITDDGQILEKYQKQIKKQKIDEAKALSLFQNFLDEIRVR